MHNWNSFLILGLAFVDEKNDRLKLLIRGKISEYLERAEKLKEHLNKESEKRARRAVGANGAATGGTGGAGKRCACLSLTTQRQY